MPISDVDAWAMTILSSVGIIMANKHVMSASGYDFSLGNIHILASRNVVVLVHRRLLDCLPLCSDISCGMHGSCTRLCAGKAVASVGLISFLSYF
jgi:hypothetical protein